MCSSISLIYASFCAQSYLSIKRNSWKDNDYQTQTRKHEIYHEEAAESYIQNFYLWLCMTKKVGFYINHEINV